ncbi:polyprenyl synthetase family protein [Flavobacterium sp. CYK-55]|uniref:polyprenyl synthetase family protein n=1 Tax=Flavobacterium sp. CYK-55 TaxID=2835529 RepID=UPI001BD0BF82|nr:polyprenyl synthetase family protein [Flavobacterium sp. CYK-55]MBS7787845.1 polyprenyl synthetase family protein [Flavobacterium sp. CYK-55]
MQSLAVYQANFQAYLEQHQPQKEPKNLYEPIEYILSLGGKRIRPILTLMSAEIFGKHSQEALPAAMAVEVFHNFSLVHDDIMDDAPLRRGNETVHEKWNLNTGILSGDAMLILAYQYFEQYPPEIFKELAQLFSKTALEVCEGQQCDIDFETRDDVTLPEYLKMIEFKTAVLVGAALQMGAIIAQTSTENARLIYDFGRNLGIAFQLQDDYLDAFGNPETFGKQVGGDIIENKKTYLYLKAVEFASADMREQLDQLYSIKPNDPTDKIESVKQIFEQTGAVNATRTAIQDYTSRAFQSLEQLQISSEAKQMLHAFGLNLMGRSV